MFLCPSRPLSRVSRALAAVLLLGGCHGARDAAPPDEVFVDGTAAAGLDFVHFNGMSGEYYFNEHVGSGAALFDFDNDGALDLYLVQGRMLGPGKSLADALLPPASAGPLSDRLFRNDLEVDRDSGDRRPRFVDVTAASGLDNRGYGMGVATGDFDNDGWLDLYVTHFGGNRLWRNEGRAGESGPVTVADVTASSGTDDRRWSTSAAFLDFDDDGWLDLYVVNYTDFRLAGHKPCPDARGVVEYCGPLSYRPETDRLFRNRGDGSFADVTAAAGMGSAPGPGLGVVTADFDGDGRVDIYVANDQAHNQLWMNLGDGAFRDEALMRGSAVDARGRAQASMGVDAGDLDGDGDVDLFMTHLLSETNTLYLNDGRGFFTERTAAAGLAAPSLPYTGFGTAMLDVDNDGWLDLLAVNGEVRTLRELRAAGDPFPLRQPNQLFRNAGAGEAGGLGVLRFEDWTARAPVLAAAHVSRGAAVGDVDNDGDPDVVVHNNSGPAQLLINRIGAARPWLGLRLVGAAGRDMLGARVALLLPGRPPLWRRVRADASFLSANDPRVLFGLGSAGGGRRYRAEVRWPGGRRERFEGLAAGRYQTLVLGSGQALPEASP